MIRAVPQEQFVDLDQQKRAVETGMWVFLGSETLFFGAVFLALTVYRILFPDAFGEGTKHLDFALGTLNTGVLLTSSWTMAVAVKNSGENREKIPWLLATILLGFVFLGIKGMEYHQEWTERLVPVFHFDPAKVSSPHTELFFYLYFLMTGLHALHLSVAIGIVGWLILAETYRHDPASSRVEITGLYWHFVDLVWVFLYPCLYLIGRH